MRREDYALEKRSRSPHVPIVPTGNHAMDVQDAIKAAKDFVPVVFSGEDVAQVRTEEYEYDGDRDVWLITLGLMRPAIDTRAGQLATLLGNAAYKRSYKVFTVNNQSGKVDAVKIKVVDE